MKTHCGTLTGLRFPYIQHSLGSEVVTRNVFGYTRRADEASWRNGYAEDCKSLNGGSIPSEASNCPGSFDQAATEVRAFPVLFELHPKFPSFPRTRESRLSTISLVESLDSRVRGNDGTFVHDSNSSRTALTTNPSLSSFEQIVSATHSVFNRTYCGNDNFESCRSFHMPDIFLNETKMGSPARCPRMSLQRRCPKCIAILQTLGIHSCLEPAYPLCR